METSPKLEALLQNGYKWIPENIQREMGHFNVFKRSCCTASAARTGPDNCRNRYKITLAAGRNKIHYADRTIHCDQYLVLFSTPTVQYSWEPLDDEQAGYYCIFTEDFFHHFGNIKEYPVFRPGNELAYILNEQQYREQEALFLKIKNEIQSDYVYKYDMIRSLVMQLVHNAIKLQPAEFSYLSASKATTRIASMFTELLERQFPIESPMHRLHHRSAVDYASQLSIHVNHLNRSIKEVMGKTTSQVIAARILQEAKALLRHSRWTISEIAYSLGFEELPHFINFFKKLSKQTPKAYRYGQDI